MSRALALLPEMFLGLGLLAAYAALVSRAVHAGRAARLALRTAAVAALVSAVLTRNVVDEFLFLAYRVDAFSQYAKALVLGAVLLSAAAREERGWSDSRIGAPFFALVAAAGAVVAASAADLVLLWLALEAVGIAFVLTAATEGEWKTRGPAIGEELVRWLVPSLLVMLGVVYVSALAGTTRFTDLADLAADVQAEPAGATGILIVLAGLAWRAGAAPLAAARTLIRDLPGAERAALAVAVWTALATIFVRFAAVAMESVLGRFGIAALVALLSFGVLAQALSMWIRATRREPRRPALLTTAVLGLGLVAAGLAAWAWEAATALP